MKIELGKLLNVQEVKKSKNPPIGFASDVVNGSVQAQILKSGDSYRATGVERVTYMNSNGQTVVQLFQPGESLVLKNDTFIIAQRLA